jgi:hypothetical protein
MDALHKTIIFLHLIGFALLLGGATAQYLSGRLRINLAMLVGIGTQLVTGLLLAAPLRPAGEPDPSTAGLVVKLVVAVAVFAMTFFSRKRDKVNRGHFLAIIALVLGNAAIGVFWL